MTFRTSSKILSPQLLYENEVKKMILHAENVKSSQLEDELAVDVLTNMIKLNDVPDLQRLALACLQTRLSLLALKQDSLHDKSGGRLNRLIAAEEKLIRSISISDLNGILSLVSPNPICKKRKTPFMDSPLRDDDESSESSFFNDTVGDYSYRNQCKTNTAPRRRNLPTYEFLSTGSRVRVIKTGQQGVVVGEKNGGWRIIEIISSNGSKVYGTYRPSDMTPAE